MIVTDPDSIRWTTEVLGHDISDLETRVGTSSYNLITARAARLSSHRMERLATHGCVPSLLYLGVNLIGVKDCDPLE